MQRSGVAPPARHAFLFEGRTPRYGDYLPKVYPRLRTDLGTLRDNFRHRTVEIISKRAGGRCSYPSCRAPTFGAAAGGDGFINVGVAAHITAASPDGPRYDSLLTGEDRRDQRNGIWLCQTHAKLIDSDPESFTAEKLRAWKAEAETIAFDAITSGALDRVVAVGVRSGEPSNAASEPPTGFHPIEAVSSRLIQAARNDIEGFKRSPGWPKHPIPLALRMTEGGNRRVFDANALAEAIKTFNEIVLVAPPGSGKTTTLIQIADAILYQGDEVAAFVPLSEWATESESFFKAIISRHTFSGTTESDLVQAAKQGHLVLALDGWNELDQSSRKRARAQIRMLRREFPKMGFVITTRQQAFDVPIQGPVVEIDSLSEDQQLEIAHSLRGLAGNSLLDRAQGTAGVRDLASIPLYLNALLQRVGGDSLPMTKDELLRILIGEHDRTADEAEALGELTLDLRKEMLTALAVEATRGSTTTLSEIQARKALSQEVKRLVHLGQLSAPLQPAAILEALVDHHALVRSGDQGTAISFHHQQIQEWYASVAVERLLRREPDLPSKSHPTEFEHVLNSLQWEEPVLFACERVSRFDQTGIEKVASAIIKTLGIDPMFAAEMIFRSSDEAWEATKAEVIDFVGRWHERGKVDRALDFMIVSGRPEFAEFVWPLISSPDDQVRLPAIRDARGFRPSVLGNDAGDRIRSLSDTLRESVLSEIVMASGIGGMEFAAVIAQRDPSPSVKVEVIESLVFRRADRLALTVLKSSPEDVWRLLAQRGFVENIADQEGASRLRKLREAYTTGPIEPLRAMSLLLHVRPRSLNLGEDVRKLLEDQGFPTTDDRAAQLIYDAHRQYPQQVASALLHRLERGSPIPFGSEQLLASLSLSVDDGPMVDRLLNIDKRDRIADASIRIVGRRTVGAMVAELVGQLRSFKAMGNAATEEASERYHSLLRLISRSGPEAFFEAILDQSDQDDPDAVALLATLVAQHGDPRTGDQFTLQEPQYTRLVETIVQWSEALLNSDLAGRGHLVEVARAMERVAAAEFVQPLHKLLEEDLRRWRLARDEMAKARTGAVQVFTDANVSWTLQYQRAFAAIGNDEVAGLMKSYLRDTEFGLEAATVLKAIWDRKHPSPAAKPRFVWRDFSKVRDHRQNREEGKELAASSFVEAIIPAINGYLDSNLEGDADSRALRLAAVAFSMPYRDHRDTIGRLLSLSEPLGPKKELLTVLVQAGEVLSASTILDGIKAVFEEGKSHPWLLDPNNGALDGWLDLLPFSDRPLATLEAIDLVRPVLRQPWQLRGLLNALGYAPSSEAETILEALIRSNLGFIGEYDWLNAVAQRRTIHSGRMILNIASDGTLDKVNAHFDSRLLSDILCSSIALHPEFRSEVYSKYKGLMAGRGNGFLASTIAGCADAAGVLLLIHAYAKLEKQFDYTLESAIRKVAISERPSVQWTGAYEVFGVPIPTLRRDLFKLTEVEGLEQRLAIRALTVIDQLRDEYGRPESEGRHPDIASGRPWPLEAPT